MANGARRTAPVAGVLVLLAALVLLPAAAGAAGPGGRFGRTTTTSTTESTDPTTTTSTTESTDPTTSTTTRPDEAGPGSGSSTVGSLFGDLYVVLRYQGGEAKVDGSDAIAVGGEPVLSQAPGWYAAEVGEGEDVTYEVMQSEIPSGCVQPVASYERWGDIWEHGHQVLDEQGEISWIPLDQLLTGYEQGLSQNRIPLVFTYDATWDRTEAEVGLLTETPTVNADGTLNLVIDPYFVPPGGAWEDPNNGLVTYPEGVLWTDLVQEVSFGRMNIARSPEHVLQAAFDEAINNINSPDTTKLEIDSAGRLLLTKNVYDEFLVDPLTGEPLLVGEVKKAIDSPLENLALYVKLMRDGHLVTPADEREPIERSPNGGMPLWKEIGLEDGPSADLRPTIDIDKMRQWGLGGLVDVQEVAYYAYYTTVDSAIDGEGQPDQDPAVVPEYMVVPAADVVDPLTLPVGAELYTGLLTDDGGAAQGSDFDFAAAFFAAAADKTGDITVDMVVYLNSILGLNQVVGTSEDGTVNYEENPVYLDFAGAAGYDRVATLGARGAVVTEGGNGFAPIYSGEAWVIQPEMPYEGVWYELAVPLADGTIAFDQLGRDPGSNAPTNEVAANDILGFTQMADDDLSVIEFIHNFAIPATAVE